MSAGTDINALQRGRELARELVQELAGAPGDAEAVRDTLEQWLERFDLPVCAAIFGAALAVTFRDCMRPLDDQAHSALVTITPNSQGEES